MYTYYIRGGLMITSRDVAKLAKVSQATVSRVFNNSKLVSEKTKLKVMEAASKLSYSPNLTARSLKSNKTQTIGMIISSYDSIFYSTITRRLEKLLRNKNYKLLVTFSSENQKTETECFSSLLASRVDGILFTPVSMKTNHLKKLANQYNISTLQLFRDADRKISSITIDDSYGTYIATKKLLNNGHRRILLIDYRTSVPTHRKDGYTKAFKENKLQIDDTYIINFNPDPELDEYSDLKDKILHLKPTAIIAVTPNTGLHILKFCKEADLKIPEDISLVVYDDSNWGQIDDISVIAHPYDEIAQIIFDLISTQIENRSDDKKVEHKVIKPFFIERKSINKI
jgi:DNA-binding LacI/PurR family transcriptional regulator